MSAFDPLAILAKARINQPPQMANQFMVQDNPVGLISPGNLPIWSRPNVSNPDGSQSTEYSVSFTDDKGHEVLVPTIVNGRFLTPDGTKPPEGSPAEKAMFQQAWKNYEKTGQHLGIFNNAANADAYAQQLHMRGFINKPPALTDSVAAYIRTKAMKGMK